MPDFVFHVSTPRLTLSPLHPDLDSHCDFLIELQRCPQVIAGNAGVMTVLPDREAARCNIRETQAHVDETGFGRYLVSLREENTSSSSADKANTAADPALEHKIDVPFSRGAESRTSIGLVSMKTRRFPGAPLIPDIGFSFLQKHVRKGYATEAAAALLAHFEKERGHTQFLGFCNPDNEGSKGTLRRLGFKDEGVREVVWLAERPLHPLVWSRGLDSDLESLGLARFEQV